MMVKLEEEKIFSLCKNIQMNTELILREALQKSHLQHQRSYSKRKKKLAPSTPIHIQTNHTG